MDRLKLKLAALPFAIVEEKNDFLSITVPSQQLYETALMLRNDPLMPFDFLIDMVGVDLGDALGVHYILANTIAFAIPVIKSMPIIAKRANFKASKPPNK